jgi:hypothetical protein
MSIKKATYVLYMEIDQINMETALVLIASAVDTW